VVLILPLIQETGRKNLVAARNKNTCLFLRIWTFLGGFMF